MKTCGIIAEYNPFHQGHAYHLEQAKSIADCIIVITSGYFSQRGLPSLLTPSDKTKLALEHGANLVIELPVCFTAQSADQFARYAIESLSCLHIDALCFGSETNDLSTLKQLSKTFDTLEKDPTTSLVKNTGLNLKPNDILACQYIRYCEQYDIEPVPIQRNDSFQSATKTRELFFQGESQYLDTYFIPEQSWDYYYPYLRTFLLMSDAQTLKNFFLVEEGIENRLKDKAKSCMTWNSFLNQCISKTYSRARIQRTCLMILLQINKSTMKALPHFHACKILGFDQKGKALLKAHKDQIFYSRFADMPKPLQDIELKTLDLYNSVLSSPIKSHQVIYYDR